jgi:DNA-binding LytR/AlgR family response regulator
LVYHYGDEEVTVRGTMKNAVQAMPPFFAQCGNSFLVNLRYVDEIRANSVVVAGKELPLTRLKKAEFMTAMASFMGGTEKPC